MDFNPIPPLPPYRLLNKRDLMTAVGEQRTELPVSSTTKSSLTKSFELSAH